MLLQLVRSFIANQYHALQRDTVLGKWDLFRINRRDDHDHHHTVLHHDQWLNLSLLVKI